MRNHYQRVSGELLREPILSVMTPRKCGESHVWYTPGGCETIGFAKRVAMEKQRMISLAVLPRLTGCRSEPESLKSQAAIGV
jgi:hypothetical protein